MCGLVQKETFDGCQRFSIGTIKPIKACEKIGIEQDDLPEWGFCAMERISLTHHDAIQLDAAWYYAPTSEGNPAMCAKNIIPIQLFMGNMSEGRQRSYLFLIPQNTP